MKTARQRRDRERRDRLSIGLSWRHFAPSASFMGGATSRCLMHSKSRTRCYLSIRRAAATRSRRTERVHNGRLPLASATAMTSRSTNERRRSSGPAAARAMSHRWVPPIKKKPISTVPATGTHRARVPAMARADGGRKKKLLATQGHLARPSAEVWCRSAIKITHTHTHTQKKRKEKKRKRTAGLISIKAGQCGQWLPFF